MHFVDECDLLTEAGHGGAGAIAFRREKFVPFGGPAGGDGGRGGDVVLLGDPGLGTLHDLEHSRVVKAAGGAKGGGNDCDGRAGKDKVVKVPLGTIVFDAETGERLVEVVTAAERVVIVRGGEGGRGNRRFATSVDRAPRRAEPGEPGERRALRLELRVLADVGLLGFPNVGKSTLIRAVSRATPKVADYPFTTLEPHLGVVTLGDPSRGHGRTFVMADIPGLIAGASEGAGLGTRFLRHVDRTRVLLHLVTLFPEPGRDPIADYQALRKELSSFDPDLATRPEIVAMTKSDLPDVREAHPAFAAAFAEIGVDLHLVSAATKGGIDELLRSVANTLDRAPSR